MPELTVIQSLNRTVFKATTSAEMRFRRPALRDIAIHSPGRWALRAACELHGWAPMARKNEFLRDRV